MLQQPDIDELLRSRLQGAEVAPPAFVWPNVERALRRRRRRFVFWIFAAGLCGTAALACWFWTRPQDEIASISTGSTTATIRNHAPLMEPANEITATEPAGMDANQAPLTPASARTQSPENPKPEPVAPALSAPRPSQVQGRNGFAQGVRPNSRTAAVPVAPALHSPTAEQVVKTDIAAAEQRRPQDLALLSSHRIPNLNFTQKTDASKFLITPPPAKKRKIRKNCYDFEKHSSVWLIDAYAGPSSARKTLRTDADNEPYLNRRLDTEHHDWAFNAGVRASWLFDKHFLLRTGVHYDQFTEVFEYVDPSYIQTIVQYTTVVVNGQPVTVADTLESTFGANYIKTYNRFGLLDIPLLAGVEWRQGNGGISFNAGATLNVLFWKRGDIIAPGADVPVTFTPGKQGLEVYRPRVGLSLSGSAQFFYHLRPKLRVFAEPYYRHILQPVNQSGHPVEQRYGIGGIRFGLTRIID